MGLGAAAERGRGDAVPRRPRLVGSVAAALAESGGCRCSGRSTSSTGALLGSPGATAPSGWLVCGGVCRWGPSCRVASRPPMARRCSSTPGQLPMDADRAGRELRRARRRGAALCPCDRGLTILEGRPARHTGAIAANLPGAGFAWRTLAHELHAKFMNSAGGPYDQRGSSRCATSPPPTSRSCGRGLGLGRSRCRYLRELIHDARRARHDEALARIAARASVEATSADIRLFIDEDRL